MKDVRAVGVLYTFGGHIKVPAGSVGRFLSEDTDSEGQRYIRVSFDQGVVRCARERVEEVK